MYKHTHRGYSFVEVVAALFILGCIALVSIPNTRSYFQTYHLKQSCQRAKELLETMHLLALASQATVKFLHDPGLSLSSNEKSFRTTPLPEKVYIPEASARIQCYKTGVCSPSNIRFQAEESHCNVTLSLRGRVRLEMNFI